MNHNFSLRDKTDQGPGLVSRNPEENQFTTAENMLFVDTRDCIGTQSLADARAYFSFTGGREAVYGSIVSTSIVGVYPVVLTLNSVDGLRIGDKLIISGSRGNTTINGSHPILAVGLTTVDIEATSNGLYLGGGTWTREADPGFPKITDKDSTINKNIITVNLEDELKFLRSLTIFHVVIPRDIIPLEYLLADFVSASIDDTSTVYTGITTTDYTTYIPQEEKYMKQRMVGFYSTPIDLWRSYTGAAFSMPNQVTPPPLLLWNPPLGAWPAQPIPYPFQTVPTYRTRTFQINGIDCYIVLGGYGVYDLVDWTIDTGNPVVDFIRTGIIRKLLLILLCPIQSYNDFDYVDLILNSETTSSGAAAADAFGFGDYQRYVPGPGLGLNYQPNTNTWYAGSGPPNVPQPDSIIPFPNFLGNVWGPYNYPGARFQKLGIRDTLQDLYLNGDLVNLFGSPIILPNVPTEGIPDDPSYGLNFAAQITVNFANIANTTNPNILNAIRIFGNGFGAAVVRANGGGAFYTSSYNSTAGGVGPSTQGIPSAWVNTGIYGAGSFADPIAQGLLGSGVTPLTSTAANVGTGAQPSHNTSYFDRGINGGTFVSGVQNFINYVVNDIPDTDLIIRVEEALRDERSQSTRSINGDCLLDVPIRLNLGSTSGTFQYIESLQSLLGQATNYWEKRYFNSKSSIHKLHLALYDYQGNPIPLEKMLQTRGVSESLQRFIRINNFLNIDFVIESFTNFNFLHDPLNPQLLGRTKRYLSIIFKANVYQGMPPGLEPTSNLRGNTFN